MLINRYEEIKKCSRNAYALRLYGQLDYLLQLNNVNKGKFDPLLLRALKEIINFYNKEKTFTNAFVKKIESSLMSLQSEAQKYTVICIGHAHIDVTGNGALMKLLILLLLLLKQCYISWITTKTSPLCNRKVIFMF